MATYFENEDNSWAYDFDEEDFCDHEDYDVDTLTGRATCNHCNEAWWLSEKELLHHLDIEAAWHRAMDEETRPTWWDRFKQWAADRYHDWRRPRAISDDDIPF